jgi:hypothetical protein
MLRWMTILAVLGVAALLATGRFRVAMGFAVGAAVGMLNFHWLWQTGKVLMEADTARVPRKTAILMVARYPLMVAGLTLLYFSGWLPLLPVIAGLLVPGGGVLVESLFLMGAGLGHKQTA